MEEEDDDFYAPNDLPSAFTFPGTSGGAPPAPIKQEKVGEDLEEGEEEGEEVEEEDSDSVCHYNLQPRLKTSIDQLRRTSISSQSARMAQNQNPQLNPRDSTLSKISLQEQLRQIMDRNP